MEMIFTYDLKDKFPQDDEQLCRFIRSDEGIDLLRQMGEKLTVDKILNRQWSNDKEDYIFVRKILMDISIIDEPKIILNSGTDSKVTYTIKAQETFICEDEIVILNSGDINFGLDIKILNTKHIKIVSKSEYNDKIIIKYRIEIQKNTVKEDVMEQIILITNYKTFIYDVFLEVLKEVPYSENLSFKNMKEFYDLYEKDYNISLQSFCDEQFYNWLSINGLDEEKVLYERTRAKNTKAWLQNFLQQFDYNVNPVLETEFFDSEGLILVRNLGKGYLFGKLKTKGGLSLNKSSFTQDDNEIKILHKDRGGSVSIISNGGCKEFRIDRPKPTGPYRSQRNLRIKFFKRSISLDKEQEIQRITQDNQYIGWNVSGNKIIFKRNLSFLNVLISKIRKQKIETNFKVIYKDRIIECKILLY